MAGGSLAGGSGYLPDPGGYWGDRTQANFSRVAYFAIFHRRVSDFCQRTHHGRIEKLRWWSLEPELQGWRAGHYFSMTY
jgi:hypothetical protein